ncbi:MAG: oligosaccharide flippase family protein, partial [Syntrophaceae bacterium]|nr:oligosaccharide flippase family protein [Syntrophaceae bacterium]
MSRIRTLIANTLLNSASSVFSQAMGFVMLPMLLKQVGLEDYGMYALATSAIGYCSIFSLMARSSVVKYASEYREGQEDRIV